MEFLKQVFGEKALTYTELETALKDNKDIKLGNLAGGAYVSKEKFDTEQTKVNTLTNDLNTANAKLEGFDPNWKQTAETAKENAQKEVDALKLNFAVEKALLESKAKNPVVVRALLETDKMKLSDDGVLGLKEQLEKIKTDNDYLFETDVQQTIEEKSAPYQYNPTKGDIGGKLNKSFIDIIAENQVKRD